MNAMHFRAKCVSASENGDYYQVVFENTDPAGDAANVDGPDRPYLLIQRQFEDPDGGRCYVETHDEAYIGHFRLRSIELSRSCLHLEIASANRPGRKLSASLAGSARRAASRSLASFSLGSALNSRLR